MHYIAKRWDNDKVKTSEGLTVTNGDCRKNRLVKQKPDRETDMGITVDLNHVIFLQ